MRWLAEALAELKRESAWGYRPGAPPACEPLALAALALAGHELTESASRAGQRLVECQAESGALGISPSQPSPHWPTGLAVLAWRALSQGAADSPYAAPIQRAADWLLTVAGETMPRSEDMGHDTSLRGWPWVEGTHSWLEPTAWNTMALRAIGQASHPRTVEGVRLIHDRLLPAGGCNYGNTYVLGQALRPHLEPSGLALLALAGAADHDGRIARTVAYVAAAVTDRPTAASLAWGLQGLVAHGNVPEADALLATAAARTRRLDGSPPRLALLALAALGSRSPLVQLGAQSLVTT